MLNYCRKDQSGSSFQQNVQSLHAGVATDTIVSQLGRVAEGINSRFTCSGKHEVPSSKPIKLVYRQADLVSSEPPEEWNSVEFPGVSEAAMIKLLSRHVQLPAMDTRERTW